MKFVYILWTNIFPAAVKNFTENKKNYLIPNVIPNLYDFLSFIEHKRRYLKECWKPNYFFHSMDKKQTNNGNQWELKRLVTCIFQNIEFCVLEKKESHTGLKRHIGK